MKYDQINLPSVFTDPFSMPQGPNWQYGSRNFSLTVRLTPRVEDGQHKMDVEVSDESGLLIWLDDHVRESICTGVESVLGLDEIFETYFEAEAEDNA